MKLDKPILAIMNGAGHRGMEIYGEYALNHPTKLKFIAVADPNPHRRKLFQRKHKILDNMVFDSWDLLMPKNGVKLADIAFICTQDRMHFEPAMRAMELGYDLFLEKPISPFLHECQELEKKAREMKCRVQIAHVLRFTSFFKKVKEVIKSGKLGKILQIEHSENISYWHFGHSYVRGPYQKESTSSPLILAKCCHDLDMIYWYLDEKPIDVYSTGELSFYIHENAPNDSPNRCTDGCKHASSCPWFAPRFYIDVEPLKRIGLHSNKWLYRKISKWSIQKKWIIKLLSKFIKDLKPLVEWKSWPVTVISDDISKSNLMEALKVGPYGKCIYKAGNDVVDHQTATYRFPSGATATLRIIGVSDLDGRELKIFGTKGTLRGLFRYNEEKIIFRDFRYNETEILYQSDVDFDAHGGGDFGILDALMKILQENINPEEVGTSDIFDAMESHYMAFAAEKSRIEKKIVEIQKIRE